MNTTQYSWPQDILDVSSWAPYAGKLITALVVPIGVGLLLYLLGYILCIVKCCKKGKRAPRQSLTCILLYAVITGFVLMFVIIGVALSIVQNVRVRVANDAMYNLLDTVLNQTENLGFIVSDVKMRVDNIIADVKNTSQSLNLITQPVDEAIAEVNKCLQLTDKMLYDIEAFRSFDIKKQFTETLDNIQAFVIKGKNFLLFVAPQLNAAKAQIGSAVNNIERYISVEFAGALQNQVDSYYDSVQSLVQQVNNFTEKYLSPSQRATYFGWVQIVDDIRFALFLVFFIFTFLIMVLALPGLHGCANVFVSSSRSITKHGIHIFAHTLGRVGWFLWTFSIIAFAFFGAHLALFLLFRDSCVEHIPAIMRLDQSLKASGYDIQGLKVPLSTIILNMLNCSGNTTFLNAAGYTLQSIGLDEDFSQKYENTIQAYYEKFNVDFMMNQAHQLLKNLSQVQDFLGQGSQKINETLDSIEDNPSAFVVQSLATEFRYNIAEFNKSTEKIEGDITLLEKQVTALKAKVSQLLGKTDGVVQEVRDRIVQTKCAVIGIDYIIVKDTICNKLPPVAMTLVVISGLLGLLMYAGFLVLWIGSLKNIPPVMSYDMKLK